MARIEDLERGKLGRNPATKDTNRGQNREAEGVELRKR